MSAGKDDSRIDLLEQQLKRLEHSVWLANLHHNYVKRDLVLARRSLEKQKANGASIKTWIALIVSANILSALIIFLISNLMK